MGTASRRRITGRTVLVVAVTAVGSCGDGGSTDRAGGDGPVVLRVATPDAPGRPGAVQIEELARQVDARSGGRLRVEVSFGPGPGVGLDDADQVAARRVIEGDVELGLVPARAWDVLGVMTLRPLNAPFLIPSTDALADVLTDDVTIDLLGGLDEIGITGLGLFPEGMRRLFFVGDTPPDLRELEGRHIHAPTSDTAYAFFEALGATPDDFSDDPKVEDAAIAEGSLVAFEGSFLLATTIGMPTVAIGNVALYPKVNALVANSSAFAELSDEHRAILRDAAGATLAWAIEDIPTEMEAAEDYCADGGRIVADDSAGAALDAAADRVIDELERDAATAALIGRIRSIVAGAPTGPGIAACARAGPVGTVRSEGPFPEGVYRAEITLDSLLAAGVNRTEAVNHAGLWTLTFEDGVHTGSDVNAATGVASEGRGVYCVEDGRIILGMLGSPPRCGDFWNAAWEVNGDQLRFVDVVSDHGGQVLISALFGGTPFTRIG